MADTKTTPYNTIITKNRFSQESIRKLARLGFDPLVELVSTYHLVNEELMETRFTPDGDKRDKYNVLHFRELLGIRKDIANSLMAYKYTKVIEEKNVDEKDIPDVYINLTTKETFEEKTVEEVSVEELEEVIQEEEPLEIVKHVPSALILSVPKYE